MKIIAGDMHFATLNRTLRETKEKEIVIDACIGQRYIGSGSQDKTIIINGTPGNALGGFLNGSVITVNGNAQDATGDTMNRGEIYIYGSSGDATGYAMRGGAIYVKGDVGYRAGIHMKACDENFPTLVIGGKAGSFLGEYQAGGIIVVLGIGGQGEAPVGNFCGTGMHGGKIFLRCDRPPVDLPRQIEVRKAGREELLEIGGCLDAFSTAFSYKKEEILAGNFYLLTPNTKNPYKQLYTVS